jgi:hypothetical protein
MRRGASEGSSTIRSPVNSRNSLRAKCYRRWKRITTSRSLAILTDAQPWGAAQAAFTMAWFHPEWYHRVISYSGTFVNQQWPFNPANPGGAWDYQETLIPNSPPEPIRIWMQVGARDLVNPNVMRDGMHDWMEANRRMAAALKNKGYAYRYVYAQDAGHCDRKVREQTLPEALEWTWQGYRDAADGCHRSFR